MFDHYYYYYYYIALVCYIIYAVVVFPPINSERERVENVIVFCTILLGKENGNRNKIDSSKKKPPDSVGSRIAVAYRSVCPTASQRLRRPDDICIIYYIM